MSRWITIEAAELAVKALEAENACLKAEVERLRAFATRTIIPNEELQAQVEQLSKSSIMGGYKLLKYIRLANSETLEFDNGDIFSQMTIPERIKYIVESHARLKAEVERLTEAGDHLWAFAHNCVVLGVYPKTAQEKINIWNAAKDGKDTQ